MHIDTEHALREANEEMRRRHQWAEQERLARQAAGAAQAEAPAEEQPRPGPLAWLRRLAGAR